MHRNLAPIKLDNDRMPVWIRLLQASLSLFTPLLAIFLMLSFVASLGVVVFVYLKNGDFSWAVGGFAYLTIVGLGFVFLWKTRKIPDGKVVCCLVAISILLKIGAVMFFTELPLNTDQALFRHFVTTLADQGMTEDVLSSLSKLYDYTSWASRGYPIHYFLRKWFGGNDFRWIQGANILFSTLSLLLLYAFACRLFPPGQRRWVVFVAICIPFQTFWVTDYSHQLLPTFYLLLFVWLICKLAWDPLGFISQMACAMGAGACLVLLTWQRGIDWIALGGIACLLVIFLMERRGWRQWGRLCVFGFFIPVLIKGTLSGLLLDDRLDQANTHRLNSVVPGFLARGWSLHQGGEYYGRYEVLDRVTPWPQKPKAMYRLALSQVREQPLKTGFVLPVLKTAKLFLVGYASNFEESLAMRRDVRLRWACGFRLMAAPLFLGLCVLGCLFLMRIRKDYGPWLLIAAIPLLSWGAYVLFGETSPRYSVYCQPFLVLLAAVPLAKWGGRMIPAPTFHLEQWRTIGMRASISVLLCAGLFACLVFIVKIMPAEYFYLCLNDAVPLSASRDSSNTMLFETWIESDSPKYIRMPVNEGTLAFYVLASQINGKLAISSTETEAAELPLYAGMTPHYYEILIDKPSYDIVFCAIPESDAHGKVQIGYIHINQ